MKRRTRSIIIVTAAIAVCVAAFALAAVSWAVRLEAVATAGKTQARAGASSLASQDTTAAVARFREASRSFTQADAMLGPEWLGGAARAVPWVGRQYVAAKALTAIGRDASDAGAEMAVALQETSSAPAIDGSTRLGALLATGRAHIDAALGLLGDVSERVTTLSEDGLDPRLAKQVRALKDALSELAPFLPRTRSLLSLERFLLSSPRRILVISQNNAELRPTGGFFGSYGILNVGPQGFSLAKYTNVYTLPDPPGTVPPPAGARMTRDFGFRDANWWIDFPTSARAMLGFWGGSYRQQPVDGIIALDVVAVRDLLEVTGPIRVASFEETFTAGTMLQRLMYLIEVRSGGQADAKDVLVALATEVENRLLSSSPTDLARAALVLAKSADEKHVQFFFTDAAAQAAVEQAGWSGSLRAPAGTTDLLAVSNAMTKAGKVNVAMKKTVDYAVALQPDGSAQTTVTLRYSNTASAHFAVSSSDFRDYLRVYRSPGTVLVPSAGTPSVAMTPTLDTGLPAMAGEFTLSRGRSIDVTVATQLPRAWRPGVVEALGRSATAPATAGSDVAHYRLFIVRQADLEDVPNTVIVLAPDGWRVTGALAWRSASGEPTAASADGSSARLALPLRGDTVFDVTMERK
jgi:hypothetical protein